MGPGTDIAQPLNACWDARGLYDEARGWVDRACLALETADGTPPPVDDPAGALWLFFISSHANRERAAYHLDAAERTYLDICDMLQAQPESPQQLQRLAGTYHHLGWVAQDRGRLEDAEQWYRLSLTIREELGNRPGMAQSFGQLGLLAETRGRPEEALEWMVRCVTLFAEFPHPMTGSGPEHLARLTAELGIDTLERCWHRVTGQLRPPVVRDFIASGPAKDAEGMRE